jgi:predicted nucleic acid-binding protein
MTARLFVDTNVLVYSFDQKEPEKQRRAQDWLDHLWSTRAGRISFQVLQEFYVIVTRKLEPGLDSETARKIVQSLWAWQPVATDERTFLAAWSLQDRFHLSWWDALIVAAARSTGCSVLLTEDLQHGQDLEGLKVIDPFQISPENRLPLS